MFHRVTLEESIPGQLYLASMPGRSESITEFKTQVVTYSINRIVCLAFFGEIRNMSPDYYHLLTTEEHSWIFEYFPIPDIGVPHDREGVPEDKEAFFFLSKKVAELLESGEHILIHCFGGVGRTGTLALTILMNLGMEHDAATAAISSTGAHPVTTGQHALIDWYTKNLKSCTERSYPEYNPH